MSEEQMTPEDLTQETCDVLNQVLQDQGMDDHCVVVPRMQFDAAMQELSFYQVTMKDYRDSILLDKLAGTSTHVEQFHNEIVIPGVNGPRPEHAHLARDTAQDIIRGRKQMGLEPKEG